MRLFLVLFLSGFSGILISQDNSLEMDRVYGLDPLLYNGEKYTYFLPPGTGGNQFLFSPDYFVGKVIIKGKSFEGITLNYDLYNQQLLLRYADETGAFNIIEISKVWLENFRLGDKVFQYLTFDDGPRFYQVLGNGPLFILLYWQKDLKLDASYGSTHFTFTPSLKSQYVLSGGKLLPFKNKRSLLALFDPVQKVEIRDYMQRNKIKLKKALDQDLTKLIIFIGNL